MINSSSFHIIGIVIFKTPNFAVKTSLFRNFLFNVVISVIVTKLCRFIKREVYISELDISRWKTRLLVANFRLSNEKF